MQIKNSIYKKVAIFSFMVFLFFSLFGTKMPFGAKITNVEDISTSNIVNQLLYSYLFLAACFALIPKFSSIRHIIKREKFFFAFIFFLTLSIIWSDYMIISLKRAFQFYSVVLTLLAFIMYVESDEEMIKYFKPILYLYVIATIIVVLVIPTAKDPQFHTWRGFSDTKNNLGEIGLVCVLLSYTIYKRERTFVTKLIGALILLLSVAIVIGTFSSTSIIALFILVGIGLLLTIDNIFKPLGIRRTITSLSVFFITAFVLYVFLFNPALLSFITSIFGKDSTFTGRTEIWSYMFNEIEKHLLLGAGFQGFWVVDSPKILLLYKQFVWLPNQAHNGYIDIVNELGIVGLCLFLLMIMNYFITLFRWKIKTIWGWFVIVPLITNFQESTFLGSSRLIYSMLNFAYLVLFVRIYRMDLESKSEINIKNK